MSDPRARFFANMQRELNEEDDPVPPATTTRSSSGLDVEFSVTESGRTVTHMLTDSVRSNGGIGSVLDEMEFSITASGRSATDDLMCFTESERNDLIQTLAGPETVVMVDDDHPDNDEHDHGDNDDDDDNQNNQDERHDSSEEKQEGEPSSTSSVKAETTAESERAGSNESREEERRSSNSVPRSERRTIPVPILPQPPSILLPNPSQFLLSQSQASSQGSSGSAFLSSVLNSGVSNGSHAPLLPYPPSHQHQQHPYPLQQHPPLHASAMMSRSATASPAGLSIMSHTPPMQPSSYEVSHFGKRPRSGSVSGRLRSASEYLEGKGMLDRQTKGVLNDLIIIGDEELQRALDRYESGDPAELEEMIRSGALQNRLPQDLDLLGDVDLDFLTVNDAVGAAPPPPPPPPPPQSMEALRQQQTAHVTAPPTNGGNHMPLFVVQQQQQQGHSTAASHVTPTYDDGIGDLEFNEDYHHDDDGNDYMQLGEPHDVVHDNKPPPPTAADVPSMVASPADGNNMSEYERRMRSNSLFCALLSDPRGQGATADDSHVQYGRWMESASQRNSTSETGQGIRISNKEEAQQPQEITPNPVTQSGLSATLAAAETPKRKPRKERKDKKERDKAKEDKRKAAADEDTFMHETGCGRPRTLSDPNLQISHDDFGLRSVERPDGWIGAYSPESRRVRIERFLEKRNHRVWTKSVKYDVRKNFADSRLRVKGRFVKKEDELMMRELMSLT